MSKSLPKSQLWQMCVLSRNVEGLWSNPSSSLPQVSLCFGVGMVPVVLVLGRVLGLALSLEGKIVKLC